jgi:hypothetical protein
MRVEKDYEELLRLFNKNKVKYCIIGAYAVALYAKPRYTKDIDILVEPNIKNAERIIRTLNEFGFGSLNLSKEDFSKKNKIVQLGYEPVRIDIITSIPKATFKQIWENKVKGTYGKEKVFFIGLNELISNKKASRRKQDLADLDVLLSERNRKR